MSIISKETWNNIPKEEKEEIFKDYQDLLSDNGYWRDEFTPEERSGILQQMEWLFPKEALQPQLTYEDVARELFKDKEFFIYDSENDVIVPELRPLNKPINCTSRKQAEKLLAINKLLNVAAYLNKNEDGTPWKPDWEYVQDKWYLAVEKGKIKVDYHDDSHNSHIVYFRTEELAKQAIQILGEDTVRLALGGY